MLLLPSSPSQLRHRAKLAETANPATVRDIEYGRDAIPPKIDAVAAELGLKLE